MNHPKDQNAATPGGGPDPATVPPASDEPSLALLETLFSEGPTGFAFLDTALRYVRVSGRLAELNGLPAHAHLGRTVEEVLGPEVWASRQAIFDKALAGEATVDVSLPGVLDPETGEARQVLASYYPVRGASGVVGVMAAVRDVTDRVRAEAALRESEARKAAILEVALDCVIGIDGAGRIVEWNPAAEETFLYTREEVLGTPMASAIIPPSLRARHHAGLAHFLATGEGPILRRRLELVGMRKGGQEFPVEIAIVPITVQGGTQFTAYLRDISDRRRHEAERDRLLAEAEARAEREALIARVGLAVRASLDPDLIQQTATALLGEGLGLDRCYLVLYNLAENYSTVAQDYHRRDLPSMAGRYVVSEFAPIMEGLHRSPQAQVVPDVRASSFGAAAARMEGLRMRAFIRLPLFDGGRLVAALAAGMADAPRAWTGGEVAVLEAVAGPLRLAVENARLHRETQEAAARQRGFLRDVLASVTEGRLRLVNGPEGLPPPLSPVGDPVPVSMAGGLRDLRGLTRAAAEAAGLSQERAYDLTTSAGEAAMNAVQHAGEGTASVGADRGRGTVQVRVEDHGGGIALEDLPHATLARGYSTKATLGHGFKMMLQMADRIFLLTGTTGTTAVLEMDRVPPALNW